MKKANEIINVRVIADSINEYGHRITTFIGVMPRYILAEFNTHRAISKNSASSRALRFEKLCDMVGTEPFIPMAFQKDHPGMQGTEYFTSDIDIEIREQLWIASSQKAIEYAKQMNEAGITKQLVNRIIEPYMYHTVIFTATELENFFYLRCPQYRVQCCGGEVRRYRSKKDALKNSFDDIDSEDEQKQMFWLKINEGMADIHMMAFAECVWDAINESTPKLLKGGEWHIPFGDDISGDDIYNAKVVEDTFRGDYLTPKIQVSTARCARISYLNYDGTKSTIKSDIALHDRLASSGHWSAFKHCAKAMTDEEFNSHHSGIVNVDKGERWAKVQNLGWSGNFKGFIQYRKMFANENRTK